MTPDGFVGYPAGEAALLGDGATTSGSREVGTDLENLAWCTGEKPAPVCSTEAQTTPGAQTPAAEGGRTGDGDEAQSSARGVLFALVLLFSA